MKARDRVRAAHIESELKRFSADEHPLPGIADAGRRRVFVEQIIDSLHRVQYPRRLNERRQSPRRADPSDAAFFDPIKAAASHKSEGRHDEACWLVYLFVYLGARPAGQWRFIREIYGGLGQGIWSWARVADAPKAFSDWLHHNADHLRRPGPGRGFGNHRKYESLGQSESVVESYVSWVGPQGHAAIFASAQTKAAGGGGDLRRSTFHTLYQSMDAVRRFGRLARFDYLCMLGKLDLAPIEPGSTYMAGATGPVEGARLLLFSNPRVAYSIDRLEQLLRELEAPLGIGMQALEDALCNWQKSPDAFIAFRG